MIIEIKSEMMLMAPQSGKSGLKYSKRIVCTPAGTTTAWKPTFAISGGAELPSIVTCQ